MLVSHCLPPSLLACWSYGNLIAQEAEKIGKAPDFFYCKCMLEETGIVTVPGSGFQQVVLTRHAVPSWRVQQS